MLCKKCGNRISNDKNFCTTCGYRVKKKSFNENTTKLNFKKLIIVTIFLVIAITAFFIYKFDKRVTLKWDESYLKNGIKYVTQTNLNLGVKLSNNDKDNMKYETTCGNIYNKGLEVVWDLNNVTGSCKIIAVYKSKKITKEIVVMDSNYTERDLSLDYKIDETSSEDLDFDGLTNSDEKKYKTNPEVLDTDLDGLDDYYEVYISKTDPNKKDTDDDGLRDYDELKLNLDPFKKDSLGDGIIDGERNLFYSYESENIKIDIKGKGNIASITSKVNSNTKISGKKGLIDNLYSFYTDAEINEAVLTIYYTDEELEKYKVNEDNLALYYYNEREFKYEKIASQVDKENNTITANLNHFSSYVIGDSLVFKENSINEILFILDNSWSLYTNDQYKQYTGKDYDGGILGSSILDGYDRDGLRFKLTDDLVTQLMSKNYLIGLSEFRYDYASAVSIGSNLKDIKNKLSTMEGNFITKKEGTNIGNALLKGIDEFSKESDSKYIVILTDGQDSYLSSKTKKIIEKATSNNVKICSIGFGGGTYNIELSSISNATGCRLYSSSNSSGLSELFENIGVEIEDNLVDVNGDNKEDGILLADSGFIVNRDGFSFANYGSNLSKGGHCYGMATFAELFYKKVLPLEYNSKTIGEKSLYSYNLSNTYFKDYNNLYNYKLKTNVLKYQFGFELFDEDKPYDLKMLDDKTLIYSDKYKKEILNSEIYFISEEKSNLDKKVQLERYGFNYDKFESLYLNEEKMQSNSNMDDEDLQMFNAIYASFVKQDVSTYYSSSSNFTLWLRNIFKTELIDYTGEKGFINILKSRLNNQDPVVITSTFGGGLHTINAINLIQDIENPNIYYIGVYDNNYPGEKRYVDFECINDTCVTKANDYYTGSNDPIRITPSLEYDLSYYDK